MTFTHKKPSHWRQLLPLAGFFLAVLLWAGEAHAVMAGRISSVQGDVSVTRLGELNPRPVTRMMEIHVNDQIMTGADGRVRILLADDSVVSLAENSRLRVSRHIYNPAARQRESVIDLYRGRVRSVVSRFLNTQMNRFEVRTPTAVAGVRGSDQVVEYDPNSGNTQVTMLSGTGYVSGLNGDNFTTVDSNETANGSGRVGFTITALSESDASEAGEGFDTEQSSDSPPPTASNTGDSEQSSGGEESQSGTGGDDGPATTVLASNDSSGSGEGSADTPSAEGGGDSAQQEEEGSGGGSESSDAVASDDSPPPPSGLSESDFSIPAPDVIPISIEPPAALSNIRVVITLPD
ncbi:MAG: FecR domain-containing protein [Deltaproteobacteria bacterium]|nr:FecR domain-containing protein [Deltaproteobacteria bacterium]